METHDPTCHAFLQNYHLDQANASIHLARVRFSPITFALLDLLEVQQSQDERVISAREHVRRHVGAYELDPGR